MFTFLSIKDKVLVIQGGAYSHKTLGFIRKAFQKLGGAGIIYLQDENVKLSTVTIDQAIKRLQDMKEANNG